MAEYTEKMTIAVSPALKAAITAAAKKERRAPTALARLTLERVFLADIVTLEQCRRLVDTGASVQKSGEVVPNEPA